jgi:hypothetical protein
MSLVSAGILGDGRVTVAPEKRRRGVGRASGAWKAGGREWVVTREEIIVRTILFVVVVVWLALAAGASFIAEPPLR